MVEGGLVLLPRLAGQLVIWAKEMYQGALLETTSISWTQTVLPGA